MSYIVRVARPVLRNSIGIAASFKTDPLLSKGILIRKYGLLQNSHDQSQLVDPKSTPSSKDTNGEGYGTDKIQYQLPPKESDPTLSPPTANRVSSKEVDAYFAKWNLAEVASWASSLNGVRKEDITLLCDKNVTGSVLTSITESELNQLGLPFGSARILATAIAALRSSVARDMMVPTYRLVELEDSLRKKLKDPENCQLYKTSGSATSIHVGVKRIATVVTAFVKQPPDATQRKNIMYVIGSPKSGKTTEAMILVPHLLEPHMSALIQTPAQGPCLKLYIDCFPLVGYTTLRSKLWEFYCIAADTLKIPIPNGVNADNLSFIALKQLFRACTHHMIITLDEYQMLLANLPSDDVTKLATFLRSVMLDPDSTCQFVVTGSTGASLLTSLEESPQNGISVFKGAGVVVTNLNATEEEIEDVNTLLAHFDRKPSTSPAQAMQSGLGFLNCAALNVVSVTLLRAEQESLGGQSTAKELTNEAVKSYASRILDIYLRDCAQLFKNKPHLLRKLYEMAIGIRTRPLGSWRTFVDSVALRNGSHMYFLREPLFTAFIVLNSEMIDGQLVWRPFFSSGVPIYDTVLLARLLPFVEGSHSVDNTAFTNWYLAWDKDNSQLDSIIKFVARRSHEYWQKQVAKKSSPNNMAQANHPISHWEVEVNKKKPIDLIRAIHNASIAHEDSPDGSSIKEGAHLFINYYGKGDRAKATAFILEAMTFCK